MIVVVLPAFNEEHAIPHVLARIQEAAPALDEPLRVVVVDDGSRDGTSAATTKAAGSLNLHIMRHSSNRGLHSALDTGFRTALGLCRPGDRVVTMDADDTHPPALIAKMVAEANRGARLVIASRFRHGAEWHGSNLVRRLFSRGVSWGFRLLWPIRGVRDYTCGYRLYDAGLLRTAYASWGPQFVSEPSFACLADVLWKVSRFKPRIAEVPLTLEYDRKHGPSKMKLIRTIRRTVFLVARRRIGF